MINYMIKLLLIVRYKFGYTGPNMICDLPSCTSGTFGVLYEVGKGYHDSKFPTLYDMPNVLEVLFGMMFPKVFLIST